MPKYWKTTKFKALEKKWYSKLKLLGFEDAEATVGDVQKLKQRASNAYRQASLIVRENKLRYYELVAQATQEEYFTDDVDKFVMSKHSEGLMIKTISERLRKMGKRCHRQTIRKIIQKYLKQWGIRTLRKARRQPPHLTPS